MNGRGMRPPGNRRPWAAGRRWLLVAATAGSILVMALSAALASAAPTSSASVHSGGQGHPGRADASQNIRSALPKPNNLGELGR